MAPETSETSETSETFHKSPGSLGDEDFACVLCVCVCVARQCSESWLVQMWYSWGSSSVWLFLLPVICATAFPGRLSACRSSLESLSARWWRLSAGLSSGDSACANFDETSDYVNTLPSRASSRMSRVKASWTISPSNTKNQLWPHCWQRKNIDQAQENQETTKSECDETVAPRGNQSLNVELLWIANK